MGPTAKLSDRLTNVREMRPLNAEGVFTTDPRLQVTSLRRALSTMGLGRGDRLAVVLPNGEGFIAAFLACLQSEITFVPFNPVVSDEELDRRCSGASVTAVWRSGTNLRRFAADKPLTTDSSVIPAVIFFSSGSEGDARPVALSEQALLHVADSHYQLLGYAPGDTIVGFLPWSHAFGFTLELLMALLHGGAIRTVPATAFPEVVHAASRVDFLFAVPRMIERLPTAVLRRLQGGIVGGAPVRGHVRRCLQATQLRVGYGQTECAPGVSLGEAGEWEYDDFLGRPLGCEVALRAGASEDVSELAVRGPNLALGYVHGERLVPVVGPDGWRATGDLAAPLGDGFVFQGRKDELFKLNNGRMVNPVPLEVPFDGQILLIGEGRDAVQPLARGETPPTFTLPVPHLQPKLMPEAFWTACTTVTGKVSRRRAQTLFYQA